jgi:hypothetical protein
MINPNDINIILSLQTISNAEDITKSFKQELDFLKRKGYDQKELFDYFISELKKEGLIKDSEVKSVPTPAIVSKQIEKPEPTLGELREMYRVLTKNRQLKEEVYHKVFSVDGVTLPDANAIDYMVSRGHHPLVAEEFVKAIRTGRLRLFKPRVRDPKIRFVGVKLTPEHYSFIKDCPSEKIRQLIIDSIQNTKKEEGVF